MSHPEGTYLGAVRCLETLRGRCVVDEDTGCWHLRTARGRPMPRDQRHVIWVAGIGHITATRAAWLLSTGREPGPDQKVYRDCQSYDCVAPRHIKVGAHRAMVRAGMRRGSMATPAKRAAFLKAAKARQVITPELRGWLLESPQSGSEVAHALDVSQGRVNAIRAKARRFAARVSPFGLGMLGAGV